MSREDLYFNYKLKPPFKQKRHKVTLNAENPEHFIQRAFKEYTLPHRMFYFDDDNKFVVGK